MTKLTSRHAIAAGWQITATPSGQRRVLDPEGGKYLPTKKHRTADVQITFRHHVPPLYLRRTTNPFTKESP